MSIRGMPTIHSSTSPGAPRRPPATLEQDVEALIGRNSPKNSTTRPSTPGALPAAALATLAGNALPRRSTPWRMRCTRAGSTPTSPTNRRRPCSEWTTTASKRLYSALGVALAGAGSLREDVVRGDQKRPAAAAGRSRGAARRATGNARVGRPRAAVAEHVGHVLASLDSRRSRERPRPLTRGRRTRAACTHARREGA